MTRQRQELQEIPPGYIYAVGDPLPPSCQLAVHKQPIPAAELLLQRLVLAVWSKLPVQWFSQLPGDANTTLHVQGHCPSLYRVKLSRNICSYIQILPTFVILEALSYRLPTHLGWLISSGMQLSTHSRVYYCGLAQLFSELKISILFALMGQKFDEEKATLTLVIRWVIFLLWLKWWSFTLCWKGCQCKRFLNFACSFFAVILVCKSIARHKVQSRIYL